MSSYFQHKLITIITSKCTIDNKCIAPNINVVVQTSKPKIKILGPAGHVL